MKKAMFALFAAMVMAVMVVPAQAQHRVRHCYYKHHHRHCYYR